MAPIDPLQIFQSALDAQFAGGEWWTVNAIALMLSVALVSIAWMVSTILNSSSLKGWAREEFSQFLFTAIIIGLLFFLIPTIHALSIGLFGDDYFTTGSVYLNNLNLELTESLTRLVTLRVEYAALSKISIPIPPVIIGYGVPLDAPLGPIATFQKMIYPSLIATAIQIELLDFMKNTMFTFVLPIGIALRAFPLTRRTGSTLIAIAIVGFVIYPISINFGDVIYQNTAREFGVSELIEPAPIIGVGLIRKISPNPGDYYLQKSDSFRWEIGAKEVIYRIWYREDCSVGAGSINRHGSSSLNIQPPIDDPITRWEVASEGESSCYIKLKTGTAERGEPILFDLSDGRIGDDSETAILIDIYQLKSDGFVRAGYDLTEIFIGDPCIRPIRSEREGSREVGLVEEVTGKEVSFNKFGCLLGFNYAKNPEADPSFTGSASSAFKGFWTAISSDLGSGIKRGGIKSTFTPLLAAYIFLDFTDFLPMVLFPALMALFTLVFSVMVSIASFRSISLMMRGESSIAEIGRLI